VYNLTAVRQSEQMLTHHLLDCLAGLGPLQRHLAASGLSQAGRLLDVGSGAGLPGIVWAIGCPQLQVCCVDTVAKKAAFITQAGLTLGLKNLKGVHARVESLSGPFDVISSRAFASLPDFVAASSQALGEGGVWLAMKGKHPADEIAAVPADVFHVEPLQVPGLSAERCLVWMRPRPAQSNPG
jgi:16S rRNA (guanine527-N7)-methyltransferase